MKAESYAKPAQPKPLHLRQIDAIAKARHRLLRPHRARCVFAGGVNAELFVREDALYAAEPAQGLSLSTRFGPAIAYDYGALLLACTGVDVTQSTAWSAHAAHAAFARYAFAALEPSLLTALGDPTVSEKAAAVLEREPTLALNVLLRLPSIQLTMRLIMTATGVHALLDSDPWQPLATPAAVPAWLAAVDAAVALVVGESTLQLEQCSRLACGDIVRLSTCRFDVAGRTTVRVGSRHLLLRWLDNHLSFEVEDMTEARNPLPDEPADHADHADHAALLNRAASATAPSTIGTADIPVRLTFSLGALRLAVGEIAALRPGSLLELSRGLPPDVTIEANGLPIGAGQLVDLDGRLAVEITQWPSERASTATS